MVQVGRLIWDTWNVAHIGDHQVLPGEVEAACHADGLIQETYGGRLLLTARTEGVLAPEGEDVYYPVTARDASKRERRDYRAQKGGGAND